MNIFLAKENIASEYGLSAVKEILKFGNWNYPFCYVTGKRIQLICILLNNNKLNQNRVKSRFQRYKIVPDAIDYSPGKYLIVVYPTGIRAQLGNVLTPTQVQYKPEVIWPANKNLLYTLIMVDPDVPSRENQQFEVCHWMVVNIPGNDLSKGQTVIEFIGSGPDPNSGKHRYTFLVFKQSRRIFTDLYVGDNKLTDQSPRLSGSVRQTIDEYNLGKPIYGNFYLAEYDSTSIIIRDQLGIPFFDSE